MKMIFYSQANKTHFHKKGFALSLVWKVRGSGTGKWTIVTNYTFFLKEKYIQKYQG